MVIEIENADKAHGDYANILQKTMRLVVNNQPLLT